MRCGERPSLDDVRPLDNERPSLDGERLSHDGLAYWDRGSNPGQPTSEGCFYLSEVAYNSNISFHISYLVVIYRLYSKGLTKLCAKNDKRSTIRI